MSGQQGLARQLDFQGSSDRVALAATGEEFGLAWVGSRRPMGSAIYLQRIGLANQTTMLMTESLEIAETVRRAMVDRWGEEETAERFTNFDTICSATQDRQDAIQRLLEKPLDSMVVIGGYNSSNTSNLANIASQEVTTYHIDGAGNIELDNRIRHKPAGEKEEVASEGWLHPGMTLGLTAGASTPNNEIGAAIQRILKSLDLPEPEGLTSTG